MRADIVEFKRMGYSDTMIAQKCRERYPNSPVKITTRQVREVLETVSEAEIRGAEAEMFAENERRIKEYLQDADMIYARLMREFEHETQKKKCRSVKDICALATCLFKFLKEQIAIRQAMQPMTQDQAVNNIVVNFVSIIRDRVPSEVWTQVDAEMRKNVGEGWDKALIIPTDAVDPSEVGPQ